MKLRDGFFYIFKTLLKKITNSDFEKIYPSNGNTNYEHTHGIIQHDAYHLGQIVLFGKYG